MGVDEIKIIAEIGVVAFAMLYLLKAQTKQKDSLMKQIHEFQTTQAEQFSFQYERLIVSFEKWLQKISDKQNAISELISKPKLDMNEASIIFVNRLNTCYLEQNEFLEKILNDNNLIENEEIIRTNFSVFSKIKFKNAATDLDLFVCDKHLLSTFINDFIDDPNQLIQFANYVSDNIIFNEKRVREQKLRDFQLFFSSKTLEMSDKLKNSIKHN